VADEYSYVIKNKTKRGKSVYTVTKSGQKIAEVDASAHRSRHSLHARINYVLLEASFGTKAAVDFSELAMLDLAPGANGIATYTTGELFELLMGAKDSGKTEWSIGP
jgi:hypothetical protein